MGYVCQICGREHPRTARDVAFSLPDVIWELGQEERQAHLDWSRDIAHFGGHWFLRGVVELPLQFDEGCFGWGCWAEVDEATIGRYQAVFSSDGTGCDRESGTLANRLRGYAETVGLPLAIQFRTADKRPSFFLDLASGHVLGIQQNRGLTCAEYEDIAASYGLQPAADTDSRPTKFGLRSLFGRRP